jgi:two-component system sensor histidine kinase MtrB
VRGPWLRRLGLRGRVTAAFAAGALALSTTLALVSYELTRQYLLDERERAAVRAAEFDATVVAAGLTAERPDVLEVLRSLDTGSARRALVRRDGEWYVRNADTGVTAAVPLPLLGLVESGTPALQRVSLEGDPAVVVGVPLGPRSSLYEVESLAELDHTLRVLAAVLAGAALLTAGAGAGLGWWASRRVLRPLAGVADAAQSIARGDLGARLDVGREPDLERLTTSFNDMVDALAARLARDRRFAADVSHELRSPLQTLSAAVSVLDRRREAFDERTAAAVGLVSDEVARFSDLVADLLELARSDQPAHLAIVDARALVHGVCRSRGVPEDLVAVEPGSPDGVLLWCLDRRRVEQALANLVDNAERHGGGVVAVRAERVGATLQIDVDDAGPGVPEDDRARIFDRFVRGRAASARGDTDGTGLGLALVEQHVGAHGGAVRVLDRPGGGSRFRMELPGAPA